MFATPAQINDRLSAVALNPQPLPPRWASLADLNKPIATVSLNPQPLPPRAKKLSADFPLPPLPNIKEALASVSESVQLRPQSSTPGSTDDGIKNLERALKKKWLDAVVAKPSEINDPLSAVALNPQPLPPRESVQDVAKPGHFWTNPLKITQA
jgi:hypothetical protein